MRHWRCGFRHSTAKTGIQGLSSALWSKATTSSLMPSSLPRGAFYSKPLGYPESLSSIHHKTDGSRSWIRNEDWSWHHYSLDSHPQYRPRIHNNPFSLKVVVKWSLVDMVLILVNTLKWDNSTHRHIIYHIPECILHYLEQRPYISLSW